MRRRAHRPSSLTSMIDVLFILVFAALAQRAVGASPVDEPDQPAAGAPETPVVAPDAAPPPEPRPRDFDDLRAAGIAAAAEALEQGEAVIVRVAADGVVRAVESSQESQEIAVPLLEKVPDPDVGLAYLGDRSAELQVCAIAKRYLEVTGRLVIVAVDGALDDLRVALVAGLRRDVDRCRGHQALAVLVEAGVAGD